MDDLLDESPDAGIGHNRHPEERIKEGGWEGVVEEDRLVLGGHLQSVRQHHTLHLHLII